jgi:hypothetical protein
MLPSKSRDSSPLTEGWKEVMGTTRRTLQMETYPAYHSLRNTAGALGEKALNYQEIKTTNKN